MRRFLTLGAAAILAAVACDEKHPILTDPVKATAYGFQMQQQATNLPRGSVRFRFHATPAAVTPESVVVLISGLDSLIGNNFYTAWIGDSLGTTFKRATGVLTGVRTDTTLDALGNIVSTPSAVLQFGTGSAIQNGNPRTSYTWAFERVAAGLTAADSMVVVVITIESSNAATTPDLRRAAIWARRPEGTAATGLRTSPIRFGNYSPTPSGDYYFLANSSPRGRGVFWGNILEVTDSILPRPPLGFYYAVYAVKGVPPGQTNGDTLFLGELTSPPPRRSMSLFHADSAVTDPEVVLDIPRAILAGSARISADTIASLPSSTPCELVVVEGETRSCPFIGFTEVRLALELKNGVRGRLTPWRVLGAAVPFVITTGQR